MAFLAMKDGLVLEGSELLGATVRHKKMGFMGTVIELYVRKNSDVQLLVEHLNGQGSVERVWCSPEDIEAKEG